MSRSRKKNPFRCVCHYISNKKDKRMANRLFRRISKNRLKLGKDPLYSLNECSNPYIFTSDGLAFYFPKSYYNKLLDRGYTQEDIDRFYRRQMSK